ncbi:HIT family protein [Candidatus Uhrbacteria bacterium]|nr:HIT family protein [Candidatus Uhrbacteria bacterium]
MENCIFCKIVNGAIPAQKVYETDTVLAFLDIYPVTPGHLLVIPKEHYEDCLAAPTTVVGELAMAIQKLAPAVLSAVGASAFNIGLNCGRDAGQVIFHLHWHLMPRFADDGLRLWPGKAELEAAVPGVAEKIRQTLES